MKDLYIHKSATIPASELHETFVRASGPGGQNVNKVATKVELRWSLTESKAFSDWQKQYLLERLQSRLVDSGQILVHSSQHRSQARNREEARMKLAELIRQALHRPKTRKKTKPSRSANERRLKKKSQRSKLKKDRRKKYDQ